jgi:hypothetical protein
MLLTSYIVNKFPNYTYLFAIFIPLIKSRIQIILKVYKKKTCFRNRQITKKMHGCMDAWMHGCMGCMGCMAA